MEPKTNRETTPALDPLLRQAINNDREALDELFARNRDHLYKQALRVLGNREDAEDALQDGLLAAFLNLSRFEGRSQFYTWLTRIVINAALMRLRQRRPEVIDQEPDGDHQPWANRIADPGPNPEETCARQERVQILEQRLQSLPTAFQQALWLRLVQGMSVRETAEALGLATGTVKSHVHRARRRLSEQFAAARRAQRLVQKSRGDASITRHRPALQFTEKLTQATA